VKPAIVVVGGFLGAGKTTLILAAARVLQARGVRTAVILNDQGGELVDTRLAEAQGVAADQVTGGCFCCLSGFDRGDRAGGGG
jgi:G3E family GTPase